jgi:DNA-binding TFAR19-related protein (PDSD5 family)
VKELDLETHIAHILISLIWSDSLTEVIDDTTLVKVLSPLAVEKLVCDTLEFSVIWKSLLRHLDDAWNYKNSS